MIRCPIFKVSFILISRSAYQPRRDSCRTKHCIHQARITLTDSNSGFKNNMRCIRRIALCVMYIIIIVVIDIFGYPSVYCFGFFPVRWKSGSHFDRFRIQSGKCFNIWRLCVIGNIHFIRSESIEPHITFIDCIQQFYPLKIRLDTRRQRQKDHNRNQRKNQQASYWFFHYYTPPLRCYRIFYIVILSLWKIFVNIHQKSFFLNLLQYASCRQTKKAGSKAALFLKRQEESSPTKGVSVIN